MTHTFKRCGHPMNEANTTIRTSDGSKYCRICRRAKRRADYHATDPATRRQKARMRELPIAWANTMARLAKLKAEAIALGIKLEDTE